ncbi:MAG: sulfatase-like hydrolase/transferase [Bryobacteraceae bacterium]
MTRRTFLATAAMAQSNRRPSVVTILCDQLNPMVTSVYGGPVPTPNLERLARHGLRFTNATCPTPFCSPTRASIVTGQYPHRHGIVYNVSKIDYPVHPFQDTEEGITRADVTADQLLHAAGYSTHQYGKWHLSGDRLPYYPDPYGEHHEYAREMKDVFDAVRKRPAEKVMNWYGWMLPVEQMPAFARSFGEDEAYLKGYTGDFIRRMGRLELPMKDVFDVRVADRTIARLRASNGGPQSITCSLNWPHDPNVVPAPWYEETDPRQIALPANSGVREKRFEKDTSWLMMARSADIRVREFLRIYYATVRIVDAQVGRVLDEIERQGRTNDTIVIFTADHGDMAGGHGMAWKSTQAFYDEIARVPMIVSWPGRIAPGRTEAAVNLTDLAPTVLELCGLQAHAGMQGRSFAPVLLGKASATSFVYGVSERVARNGRSTRSVASTVKGSFMIRGAEAKYVVYADGEEFLYDLKRDAGETRNLAGERGAASLKEKLRGELRAFLKGTEYPGSI